MRMVGSFGESKESRDNDPTNTEEYRTAFQNYICNNVPIPENLRANATTKTTDAETVIPTVLVNQIIEKQESVGMILPLITKTNYAAGVEIPTSALKPKSYMGSRRWNKRQTKENYRKNYIYTLQTAL